MVISLPGKAFPGRSREENDRRAGFVRMPENFPAGRAAPPSAPLRHQPFAAKVRAALGA
jgi:hypothetical protein